jgi:hypothetical protein
MEMMYEVRNIYREFELGFSGEQFTTYAGHVVQ